MKPNRMIRFLAFCAAVATFAACNDWTEMETVDSKVEKPWEQDPALWAEYTAALRAYKQSEHFIVYARLHNSPEKASSEQDFMRCLPDSLDIVTLTNADNFSKFDAEDMDVMRRRGRKYFIRSIMPHARKSSPICRRSMPIWIRLSPPSPPTAWTATRLRPTRWRRMPQPASSRNLLRRNPRASSSSSRATRCRLRPPTVPRSILLPSIRRNSKMCRR